MRAKKQPIGSKKKHFKAHRVPKEARKSAYKSMMCTVQRRWLNGKGKALASLRELAAATRKPGSAECCASIRSGSFAYAARALEEEGILRRWAGNYASLYAPWHWGPPPRFNLGPPRDLFEDTDSGSDSDSDSEESIAEDIVRYRKPEWTIEF